MTNTQHVEGTTCERARANTGLIYTGSNQGMGNRRKTQLLEIRLMRQGKSKTEHTDIRDEHDPSK